MVEISTSILNVEKENATQVFYNLEVAHTDYFHIDIMDGKFVPSNTKEQMLEYTNSIKQISNIPLDVHFMVENVKEEIDKYIPFEPNIITFHYEAAKSKEEIMELINYIKQNNIKVGISVKPDTQVEKIYEFLPYIHMVLIMTVEPGKGGQKLIGATLEKITKLKQYITNNNLEVDIEADGGINQDTVQDVKKAGVDIIVAGSAIVKSDDFCDAINKLKN
jgi:ribulose-phosphate 3-epimerase